MNKPADDEAQAFYSIKELEEYYGDTIDFSTALDYSHDTDESKYEEGDTSNLYDEVDGDDKQQYNFYALSNLTEEDEALEKFIQRELAARGQAQEC